MSNDNRLSTIRDFLSKPYAGPSISLIVLLVSLTSLAVGITTYVRQGARWAIEDNKKLSVSLVFQPDLTQENMRWGNLSFTTQLDLPVKLTGVELEPVLN